MSSSFENGESSTTNDLILRSGGAKRNETPVNPELPPSLMTAHSFRTVRVIFFFY